MRAGEFGDPYRRPCGGWSEPSKRHRGCGRHFITAHAAIQKWENITKVANYVTDESGDPEDPTEIAPYPKPRPSRPTAGDCPGDPTCPSDPPGPSNIYPKCGEWTDAEKPTPIEDATHTTIDGNIYHKVTGETVDLAQCHKYGFKNVQARKVWQGRFGWMSSDPGGFANEINCGDCSATYEPERTTADQTKYLTIEATATISVSTTGGATAHEKVTVSSLSGVVTQDECDYARDEGAFAQMTAAISLLTTANASGYQLLASAWARELDRVYLRPDLYTTTIICDGPQKMTATAIKIADSSTAFEGEMDYAAGTISITVTNVNGSNTTVMMSVSNTLVSYSREDIFNPGAGPDEITTTENLDAELTNACTAGDVNDAVDAMLGEWDLADDARYPWRTDGHVNIAPLLTRDEVPYPVAPTIIGVCDWTDPNTDLYTGNLRGVPLPAGYGPHFDWRHKTWWQCNGGIEYHFSTGAWSGTANDGDETDAVVPATATQWTENYGAISGYWEIHFPRGGAWRNWAGGVLNAQKWAEIKEWRPSQNYFGPAGHYRFVPDQTTVRCVDEFDGTNVSLIAGQTDPAYAVDDFVILAGTGNDGLYQITGGSGDSWTVDAKIQDLPPDFQHYGVIIGRVRFPDCPAIGGRVKVVSATQNGAGVDIVIASNSARGEAYLRTGDHVDFTDVPGLGSNLEVTVTDWTHFSVPGTLSGAYDGDGYVTSTGAPHWKWYDNQSKGDYVLLTWEHNMRDWQERDRVIAQYEGRSEGCAGVIPALEDSTPIRVNQEIWGMPRNVSAFTCETDCLTRSLCSPNVICISPNYDAEDEDSIDKFPNSNMYPLPTLAGDDRYGARWMMAVAQFMTELYWQQPYPSCEAFAFWEDFSLFEWTEDDGSCAINDGTINSETGLPMYFYPQRPYVEAPCSLPFIGEDEAPALPAGIPIGCLSLAELDTTTPPSGNVCPPPVYPGNTFNTGVVTMLAVPTPWATLLREEDCVCSDRRADIRDAYEDQGVKCP